MARPSASTAPGTAAVLALTLALAAPAAARLDLTKSHVEVDRTGTPGLLCAGDEVLFTVHVECAVDFEHFRLLDVIDPNYYSFAAVVLQHGIDCSTGMGPLTPGGPNAFFCDDQIDMLPLDTLDFQYRTVLRDNGAAPRKCQQASARNGMGTTYLSNADCVDYFCPVPALDLVKTYTGPAAPAAGEVVSWRVELVNNGGAADSAVRVRDSPDPGELAAWTWSNFSRPPDAGTPLDGQPLDVTWNTIGPRESVSFEVSGVLTNCAARPAACNQASVTSGSLGSPLLSHPPGGALAPTCVSAPAPVRGRLSGPVTKTLVDVNGPPIAYNDDLRFTIRFENEAWCATPAGSLIDVLPPALVLRRSTVLITPPGAGTDRSANNTVEIRPLVLPPRTAAGPGVVTVEFNAQLNLQNGRVCNVGSYEFGTGTASTEEVCLGVGSYVHVVAAKAHDDPNGDGTLGRGQDLVYTVTLENQGTLQASGVRVSDPLPPGLLFVSLDDDASGTVVSAGPTLVEIDAIVLDPGPGAARTVRFTTREDGTLPLGDLVCNQATVTAGTTSLSAGPACVELVAAPACAQAPLSIVPLQGIRQGIEAAFSWPAEANSARGYRLYAVNAKAAIPAADAGAGLTPECATLAQADTACADLDALDPGAPDRLLFYQVVGVCADGTEGVH